MKKYTTRTTSLNAVTADIHLITADRIVDTNGNKYLKEGDVSDNSATLDGNNVFTGYNTFSSGVQALPLGTKTALGADAYGLHVSSTGGVQIWGTHFLQGDEWTNNALKIQHRNLALLGDHTAPTTLTFDNANTIEFKVMPNDGSTANDGQGAIFDFSAWQWDNDSHTTKNSNCPVQILKNNAGTLTERSLLNKSELDANYASKDASYLKSESDAKFAPIAHTSNSTLHLTTTQQNLLSEFNTNKSDYARKSQANTFTNDNTFQKSTKFSKGLESDSDVIVKTGNIFVNKGSNITFLDDGEVTITNGASGYPYEAGIPTVLDNGRVYDLGVISDYVNLSDVTFNGDDTLIQTCEIWFTTATDVAAITWPDNVYWIDYDDGVLPELKSNMKYRISIRKEITDIVASISYVYPVR